MALKNPRDAPLMLMGGDAGRTSMVPTSRGSKLECDFSGMYTAHRAPLATTDLSSRTYLSVRWG